MLRTFRSLRFLLVLALLLIGGWQCTEADVPPGGVLVITPTTNDPAVERLMPALTNYLKQLTGHEPKTVAMEAGDQPRLEATIREQKAGLVLVLSADLLVSAWAGELPKEDEGDSFVLRTIESEGTWKNNLGDLGATIALTMGRTRIAKQYAIYEFLRRLGARFYHPEQEYLPQNPLAQLRERARTATIVAQSADGKANPLYKADFEERSYTFHGAHPLEHQEAFSDANHPIKEAANVNDWIVKNRGNRFRGLGRGAVTGEARDKRAKELDDLRILMGFPSGAGITLHNEQQGATAVVDRASQIPPKQQIEDYVAARLKDNPAAIEFGIHFGPTEFTVTPDKETVDWVNWAGQKALSINPKLKIVVNNHISGTQPTPNFDDFGCTAGTNPDNRGDYYDLSFHTDKRFVTKLHTVMFYPLEGPAFVYNQKTFSHKLCLMEKASKEGRPLIYFPEGSWWLSFDNSIPVYLPLYILARGRDIELIKGMLKRRGKGTLYGHRMFNSGHEWGYWQQDYAVGLWHWNADLTLKDVTQEMLDPLCAPKDWKVGCKAREEATKVMLELMDHQKQMFLLQKDWRGLEGGLFAYMAGEDPADEIAAVTGFEFRPVKVAFQQVASWDTKQIKTFEDTDLKALKEMDTLHQGWLKRLNDLESTIPEAGKPWLAEIVDGIENNMLRARQTVALYEAVILYRKTRLENEALLKADPNATTKDPKVAAEAPWKLAGEVLLQAEAVIRRREKSYRYPGAQVYGGGDTPDKAVENGTTYPWRVHFKTHVLSYWKNRHEQVKALLDGQGSGDNTLTVTPTIAAPGEKLTLKWPKIDGVKASVTIGGKAVDTDITSFDLGAEEGFWKIEGRLLLGGREIQLAGGVARAKIRGVSAPKSFNLTSPDSALAKSVLKSLFPSILWARVAGAAGGLAFAPDLDEDGNAGFADVVFGPIDQDGATFSTKPVDFPMPIPDPGSKQRALTIRATGVIFSGEVKDGKLVSPIKMKGELVIEDLVDALNKLAGFDRKGALQTLASVLQFDAKNPPAKKPFEGELALTE